MDKIFQLFDSRLHRNYVVSGKFRKLIPLISFRLPPRNFLDQIFLYLQLFIKSGVIKDPLLQQQFGKLNKYFKNIDGFIFFKTSWYKETQFTGILQDGQEHYFIKIFKSHEETLFQENQFNFVNKYFSDYFSTITIEKYFDNILANKYIPHARPIGIEDHIEHKILEMTNDFINKQAIVKPVKDCLPIDLGFVLGEQKKLLGRITSWAQKQELSIIPVHGDMTPWNMFVDDLGQIVLVDYEAAGWQVAFYDYFHFILQPLALKKNAVPIDKMVIDTNKDTLILYLVHQLYKHHSEIKQSGFDDKAIRNLVHNKIKWLNELLDAEY
jgi:hypothetical protein